MELMATCLDKLLKKTKRPIPERILGKMAVAVSIIMYHFVLLSVARLCPFSNLKNLKHVSSQNFIFIIIIKIRRHVE